ncbi:MAG: tetratricopeptide repeat protein [Myxococcaceae bacterium]
MNTPMPREAQFRKLISDFPTSPMGHFSLGKLLLEARRYAEAAEALANAVKLNPEYAAALLALGDAWEGAGKVQEAREVFERAKAHALAQNHPGLAEEIDARIDAL